MEKDRRKEIRRDIKASTIPEELKLMYLLANAVEIMSQQSMRRLESVYVRHGYNLKENTMLTGLNQYCRFVKLASCQFFDRVDPHIINATWGVGRDADGAAVMDSFNEDSNEIIRLVMLYVDRTARDRGGFGKVFKTLRQLPSAGLFEDADIARYKMRDR